MSTTQNARKKFTLAKAQENLYARSLANVICAVDTSKTGTVYNPFTSQGAVTDGTAQTTYAIQAYSADADSLQINRRATFAEHIDNYDEVSIDLSLLADRGMNAGKSIAQKIDGYVLSLPVTTAGVKSLGNNGVVGSTTPWTSSNTVIDDIINTSLTELHVENAEDAKKFMVVSPYEANDLRGFLQGTGNMVMDTVLREGIPSAVTKVGTTFSGVDVFMSNNLRHVAVLSMATNPTAGDTITFAGVTYTFVATLTGAAGEIHITGSVDATRANLAEAINGTTLPGDTDEAENTNTGYSALSDADQAKLSRLGVTAVDSAGADTLTITANGTFSVSETLTDATDAWGTVYKFLVFGDYGSIALYMPSQGATYKEKDVSGKHGIELEVSQLYNATIWTRMKNRVLNVLVN
jgi:hypothetical protein